ERDREGGKRLAAALAEAVERIGHCQRCRDFSESDLCAICASASRDAHLLCAVETPADRLAIEQATDYRGLYLVLHGRLSPLDGSGARGRGLERRGDRLVGGGVQETIIASNPTGEGEVTAHYLAQLARQHDVRPSRPAHGRPLCGELEYVDRGTLSHAFGSRSEVP